MSIKLIKTELGMILEMRYNTKPCWSLPSNQSFYGQIAGYLRGVRDPRVGQW